MGAGPKTAVNSVPVCVLHRKLIKGAKDNEI